MRLTKEQIIRVVNNGAQYTNPTTDEMDFYIKLFFLRYGYFVPTEERKILSSEQLENCMVNYCSKHGRPTGETMVVYVTFEELIKCSSKKSHPWRYLVESDLVVIDELFYTTPTEEELLLFYKAIMKLSNERSLILISNRDLPLWNEMKADRHVIETLSARLSHNSQMIYL